MCSACRFFASHRHHDEVVTIVLVEMVNQCDSFDVPLLGEPVDDRDAVSLQLVPLLAPGEQGHVPACLVEDGSQPLPDGSCAVDERLHARGFCERRATQVSA